MKQNLLCLAMILRDEAPRIRRTLESVAPFIDSFAIYVDDRTTDGTAEVVAEIMAGFGVDGVVVTGPFGDYSAARNRALELAHELRAEFTLMLSAEERLIDGAKLRAFLEVSAHFNQVEDAIHPWGYELWVQMGETRYPHPRVVRSTARARYYGVTHEAMPSPDGNQAPKIEHGSIVRDWDPSAAAHAKRVERWKQDRVLLEAEREKNPHDTRTRFYLAQTYQMLGELRLAAETYVERYYLGGWAPERFEALLRAGVLFSKFGELDRALWFLNKANKMASGGRAEALVELAAVFEKQALEGAVIHFTTALDHAARAAALKPPTEGALFVDVPSYTWKPLVVQARVFERCGRFSEAAEMAKRALEKNPPEHSAREMREILGDFDG